MHNDISISEKFEEFHALNPHVYELFVRYSRMALDRGFERFSAKAVFERLRWHLNFETRGDDTFKINNNYTALYARKTMEEYPEFVGFFELRERISER